MLSQYLCNEKLISNDQNQYFNISSKQKLIFDLKRHERDIVKEASENIKRNISKIGK